MVIRKTTSCLQNPHTVSRSDFAQVYLIWEFFLNRTLSGPTISTESTFARPSLTTGKGLETVYLPYVGRVITRLNECTRHVFLKSDEQRLSTRPIIFSRTSNDSSARPIIFSRTSNDSSTRPIWFYGQRAPQRVRVPRVILVLVRRMALCFSGSR